VIDVRDVPIRSSFVSTAVGKCFRLAKLQIENPLEKKPHYFLGGSVFALMMEEYHRSGYCGDIHEFAATCIHICMQEENYSATEDQVLLIIDRCATAFIEYIDWVPNSGLKIIGSEIEVRSVTDGGRECAIKVDILAVDKNQKIYMLDAKTFGMWGASISASVVTTEQLRMSLQVAMYSWFLERGGDMYVGQTIGRTETNAEVAARCESIPGRIKPDFVGYINVAMLTRRKRTTKNGKAGDRRGNPLTVIPYDVAMKEYAKEQINAVELMMTFNQWPRVQKFERGYSTCLGCQFKKDCWDGRATPSAAPSWLDKKTETR